MAGEGCDALTAVLRIVYTYMSLPRLVSPKKLAVRLRVNTIIKKRHQTKFSLIRFAYFILEFKLEIGLHENYENSETTIRRHIVSVKQGRWR